MCKLTARHDPIGQHGQQGLTLFPAEAGIGDRQAILQLAQWRRFLAAPLQKALDHDGGNGSAPASQLAAELPGDQMLVLVQLLAVREFR